MSHITFSDLNLNNPLLNALDDLEIKHPTTIQEKVFPVVMSGKDVVGIAQTGTGKTYAYLLPMLRQWKFTKEKHPQILIIVPTRELVSQVVDEVKKLTEYMNVEVTGVFGGVNIRTQADVVFQGQDVLVATPGRLLDLRLNGALSFKSIKKLVIDEVDEMLNLGFLPQLIRVIDLLPPKRQNLMFSATLTKEVETLINDFFHSPEFIEAAPTGTPLEQIDQCLYQVPNFNTKINLLHYLLAKGEEMEKILLFAGTKKLADQLFESLVEILPDSIGVIHSNKAQNNRFLTVKRFHEGEIKILIATDIMARGIDIAMVTHVINFDTPEVPENYMHRIGRTGRADKKGTAITLVADRELGMLANIEGMMHMKIPKLDVPQEVEISDVLTEDELPKVVMPNIDLKTTVETNTGLAYHEKKDKNKKTNSKVRHDVKMKKKYKRPKTRGQKRK